MGPTGHLVTIKRSGVDGPHFPLSLRTCLFGRGIECDIRIQLPVVSKQHCKIEVKDQEAILYNLSSTNPTQVNGSAIEEPVQLKHGDVITIVDRSFRYENESRSNESKSTEFPGQKYEQKPSRRVSRSSFSSTPDKCEGMSLTRRRVSFGGHLRPELFDENLPPNTPLKRGETPSKRQSLVAHTPTVLKKIIKEQPQPTGKEESLEISLEGTAQNVFMSSPAPSPGKTSPAASDQRQRSRKASPISSRGKSPHQTDVPRGGGRKSGNLPAKRTSIGRSKHDILQMICSKRRSGASEANLIVAKSWADVVKLGAKQTQTKVIKHGPQRQPNKRRRRPDTPKKPMGSVHNQFSTGHANSPCTIVIGKAHAEKVNMPARPYRMLNSFVFNQKMDLKEDLSGITEMFKTPEKETSQMLSTRPVTLSYSENLLGEKFPAADSGENPLLPTSGSLGENVFSKIQIAAEELSDKCSASPTLGQQCINKSENAVKTPRNIYKMTDVEMKTPDADREPLKTVSSANKLRRSMVLRKTQVPPTESSNEETKAAAAETITGRSPRKMPVQGKKAEGEMEGSERPLETYEEDIQSKENSEKRMPVRRSRGTWGQTCAPAADLAVLKRLHDAEPMKDLSESQGLLQTPDRTEELMNEEDKTSKIPCKPPQPAPVDTPASTKRQLRTPLGQVDVTEELSAVRKRKHRSGETTLTHTEPIGDGKGIKVFEETPKQKHNPTEYATGRKTWPRTPKEKTRPLGGLLGFKEQFQTSECTEDPMTDDKVTKVPSKFPQSEPADTLIAMKTQPKIPLGKEDVEEELSALTKLTQTSGKVTCSPKAPAGDKGFKAFKGSAKQNLDRAANITASRRRHRAPKQKTLPLEDLAGFKELFQTPGQDEQSKPGGKTSKTPCRSPQSEPAGTPRSTKRWLKTNVGKVDVKEELSTLRKLMQASRETLHTPSVPEGEDKGIRALMRSPKQKLYPEENLTECTRQLRTPKEKALLLEDLAGFKELFQTPSQAGQPMADGKTSKTTCKSPQPEPVKTPASSKRRLKTSMVKVDVEEELLALRKLTQASGKAMQMPKISVGDENDIKAFMGTPKQNLDLAENLTGHKRQPRTPKEKAVPLEDLAGFQDLFQAPEGTREPETDDKPKIHYKSPQPEPVKTPASSKRWLKTSMVKVDIEEELPALRKLTQASGVIAYSPKAPAGDKGFTDLKESAKQTPDSAASATGSKKRPRAPKEKAPPLEDLTGIKELFQTSCQGEQPVTDEKPSKIPCKSPQPEPVDTPTNTKRQLRTSLGKVDVKEELSALRKLTWTLEESMHTPSVLADDNKGIRVSKELAKQKLDPAENVTPSKRQPRAPKERSQLLEDLAGFRELFQTPDHTEESMSDGKTTKIPCKFSQPEPVKTPASSKRRLKTNMVKMDVEEELLAFRKLTQASGKAMQTPKISVGEENDIKAFMGTPKENLDLAENLTRHKRQPRTPKEKAVPLEDLAGFQDLFQAPEGTREPETDDKPKICSKSQPEPVKTPASSKRWLKTSMVKVDIEEELPALRKLTQASGVIAHSPKAPAGDKGFTDLKESAKQTLDSAASVTGSKKRPRAPKEKAPPLEDLTGLKELFQTPGQGEQPVTDEKPSKIPCKSPQPEPVNTPTSTKKQLRTSLGKVDVKEELSALRKLTRTLEESMHTPSVLADDNKGIRVSKELAKQKLDPAENVTPSKRQPRAPKEKSQPLEDLAGFRELFQTPGHTEESMSDGKTTKIPCKFSQPEPVKTPASSKRRLKTNMVKVDVEEELLDFRKLTQASGKAMQTPKISVGEENDIKAFMGTPKENLDLAENLTRHKRQPRTPKEKAVPLEDPAGFQDLFQAPEGTREPETDDKPKICSKSQPEPVKTPASSKRWLKTSMVKVDIEEELPALRKLTQASGVIAHSPKAPAGDKGFTDLKESAKHTPDSAASVTGSKKRPRAPKEKAPPLEDLTGLKELFQTPDQGEQPVTDEKPSKIPCKYPQPEIVKTSASTKRRLKTSVGKVDMKEEFSALKKLRQTSGETKHSLKARAGDENIIRMPKESAKQKRDPAANVTASKRQPRAPKEKAQPLKGLAGCRELFQTPGHTEELRNEAESLKSTPQQTPGRWKPLKVLRRVIRAPKVKPVEDLVGPRDPVQSQRKSNTPQSPKRKCGKDTGVRGTKRQRCVTTPLEIAEKPVKKKQRTSPGERCQSPEPLVIMKKSLRKFAKRIEPVEDLSSNMKTEKKEPKVGDSVTPNKGMSLRPRRQNKTDVEQQRPEILVSEEKIKIKINEKKSMKRSQEVEPRPPDEGAKKPTSTSKVSESRMCLRSSGRQDKIPQPNTDTAEKKIQEKSVGVPRKDQKEKGGAGDSDVICLRSRKIAVHPRVDTSKSESEQRVTRRVKRCAEHPKTDKDAACIKKIRTRSHRDSKDI
ncbi:proliferation marker protein Ki-67 [Cynocephalus volans]|uniref:proliferation marker protein Ki-67 n=1 Tax=Cynocephalus volans TaxID=110931 RepID=UPI002FC92FA9